MPAGSPREPLALPWGLGLSLFRRLRSTRIGRATWLSALRLSLSSLVVGAHVYRLLDFVALSGTGMPVLQTCPKEGFGSRSERRRARLNSRRFSNKVSVEKSESCDSVSVSSGRRRGQLNSRRFSTIPSEQNCRDQYRSLHTFQSL